MNKILLAYDGSEPARHAAARAGDLARHEGCGVLVLVVGELIESGYGTLVPVVEADVYEQLAEEGAGLVAPAGVEVERRVVWGRPSEKILEVAREVEPRYMVMGHRGKGGLIDFLLGSVSKHVIDHAHCSVLVVR